MTEIEVYFEEFLNYLKSEKDVSKATLSSYQTDFNILMDFLESNGLPLTVEDITTVHLRKYITYLKIEKEFKTRTIRRKIHSLSSFFKYLLEQEYIVKNPMLPIHAPKEPDTVPIYVTQEDARKLIEAPMRYKNEFSQRDQMIMYILFFTGMRKSEVLSLNFSDINFKENTITIKKGKGNKQRVIPLISPLDKTLWSYLQSRLPLKNEAVFLSKSGTRLGPSQLQVIFQKYLRLTGLTDKGYTIHKCRHSFATLLIQNSVDLITIQTLLGHQDLNTTRIYSHLNMNHIEQEVRKFPLSDY